MRRRGPAAVGDGWHVGVVTVLADETSAVLDVFGIAAGPQFRTGRMAVPGGVTYLVVAPPGELASLCARYDPAVVVIVGGGQEPDVTLAGGQEPAGGAITAFFAAAGEPATLPGYGGSTAFRVARDPQGEPPDVTARRGRPRAWARIRGDARNGAQALRYLVPYLRQRL
jgi:hypothetical protein